MPFISESKPHYESLFARVAAVNFKCRIICSLIKLLVKTMPSNAQSKFIRSLHRKKARREQGLFLVEGEKVVAELLASHWQLHSLYATREFIETYQPLVNKARVDVVQCSGEKLSAVSTLQSNAAALAIVYCPVDVALPSVSAKEWVLLLDGVNDPGNLGSILRIADWYGIKQVVCSPSTVELFNPKVIAASKGSFLRVSLHHTDLLAWLASIAKDTHVLGAFLQGESIHSLKPAIAKEGGLIVLGNEAQGISADIAARVNHQITIPSFGEAESLNVAMATAIICDNIRRLESIDRF